MVRVITRVSIQYTVNWNKRGRITSICCNQFCILNFLYRVTNDDGRCPGLLTKEQFPPGLYKITFDTKSYFTSIGVRGFYPYVDVSLLHFSFYPLNYNRDHMK